MIPISPEEMKALDENCRYFGLLPLQLMENAGNALAREILASDAGSIAVVAGKGNNGGDAFAASRHLDGHKVTLFLIGRSRDISTEEARQNLKILKNLNFDIREVADASDLGGLSKYDLVVDALFGTGVRSPVRGLEASAIDAMNSAHRPVISVDVPSGLGTNKEVKPDLTVTFHRPKTGLAGNVKVADIGIPEKAEYLVGPGDLHLLGSKSPDSHKGDSGYILVIGGGPYTGAPALTAMAALRAGADVVTVATPKSSSKTIAGFSPDLIVRELSSDVLCPDDLGTIKDLISKHDVVVVGNGVGRAPETHEALARLIPWCNKAVIDADALQPDLPLKGIVTPHAGEFRRISSIELPAEHEPLYEERIEPVKKYAREHGLVVLVKGRVDIISDGQAARGNTTGNPGMTVGGTGDVLAGITGAFYSISPAIRAAVAAAFISGRAGDLAFEDKGDSLMATDVIEKIPQAMKI